MKSLSDIKDGHDPAMYVDNTGHNVRCTGKWRDGNGVYHSFNDAETEGVPMIINGEDKKWL
jgi:hypothetical protein